MSMGEMKFVQHDLLNDRYLNLPPKMQRYVDNSWAPEFFEQITSKINAEKYRALFSEKSASRPSTEIQILVASLIIKEMQGVTDEQLIENIFTSVVYQYALGLTSAMDIEVSDRTFGRFRERLTKHKKATGRDLIQEEFKEIAIRFCQLMNINRKKKRMDSLMIDSRGKYMTRLEIIHVTNKKCVKKMNESGYEKYIPYEMQHYLNKDDTNKVVYHQEEIEIETRLEKAINESFKLYGIMNNHKELRESDEYAILSRMIGEQTKSDERGIKKLKDKKEIAPTSLQNPNDPESTYRYKAGKQYHGYVGNVVQAYNEEGCGIVTEIGYEQNVHSDAEFMKEYAEQKNSTEKEEVLTDGAYKTSENDKITKDAGIEHIATSLVGRLTDEIATEFEFNEEGTEIIKCPMGYRPIKCSYNKTTEQVRAVFEKKECNPSCPYFARCRAVEQKKTSAVSWSKKSKERAEYQKTLQSEELKQKARERNAVEGIPSVLRNRYRVDRIPVFGIDESRVFFIFKIMACNFTSYFKYAQKQKKMVMKEVVFA